MCVCSTLLTHSCEAWNLTKAVSRILNGFNSRCLHVITGEEYRDTAISPAYNLLLVVRQRRLRYLGHLLRLPCDSVVRRTQIAMTDGDNTNRYPEGSIFIDCQGSELKDLELRPWQWTALHGGTKWRHLCFNVILHHWTHWVHYEHDDQSITFEVSDRSRSLPLALIHILASELSLAPIREIAR